MKVPDINARRIPKGVRGKTKQSAQDERCDHEGALMRN